tara:strand:+ start:265 stop:636 length:372 start_codon:yes stop_codon:yes gene_type:complete
MSTIRTNTLLAADGSTTTEPSIPALDQRMAKAWIGGNNGTILSSYNISSVTDTAGDGWTVSFTNAMSDDDYAAVATISSFSGAAQNYSAGVRDTTTTTFKIMRESSSGVDITLDNFSAIVFGN